jgi:hypothetical protein
MICGSAKRRHRSEERRGTQAMMLVLVIEAMACDIQGCP